jgi:hypothetical protein
MATGNWQLVGEFTEVERGKHSDWPQLAAALAACKKHRAKLVIAKLDRLSRNLAFIAAQMDSGVEFVAIDNPHANKLTVHILAAVAQHERERSDSAIRTLGRNPATSSHRGQPGPPGRRICRRAEAVFGRLETKGCTYERRKAGRGYRGKPLAVVSAGSPMADRAEAGASASAPTKYSQARLTGSQMWSIWRARRATGSSEYSASNPRRR